MPGAGLEPARGNSPRDFKSLASTDSATRANKGRNLACLPKWEKSFLNLPALLDTARTRRIEKAQNPMAKINLDNLEDLVKKMISEIGEDPKREGLAGTPRRVAKSYQFLTK